MSIEHWGEVNWDPGSRIQGYDLRNSQENFSKFYPKSILTLS